MERIAAFLKQYEDFYRYYKTGDIANDASYFTRHQNDLDRLAYFNTSSKKAPVDCDYSALQGAFLAMERYAGFIKHHWWETRKDSP